MNVTLTEDIRNIVDTIIKYFTGKQDVLAVYLFGSTAKNLMRKNSDVDIAVLLNEKLNDKEKRFDFILTVGMELEKETGLPFDVVDITAAPPALQHQILKTGQLLVENNRSARINFEVGSRRKYFDLLPLYQARDRMILQKLGGVTTLVEPEVIREKIKYLAEYINDLEQEQAISLEEFLSNKQMQRYIERTLHLSIECCLDIGSHIISSEKLREPESNKDIFHVLAENGYIPKKKTCPIIKNGPVQKPYRPQLCQNRPGNGIYNPQTQC